MLSIDFFNQHTVTVAKGLLGKRITFNNLSGIILETEAYRGSDDPASHAFKGATKRSAIMFGMPGYSYVYLIYGMHHCLNIVTETENNPGAVLIRAIKVVDTNQIINGPGKLCKFFGITTKQNNICLINNQDFYISNGEKILKKNIQATSRIGIRSGQDKLWRFLLFK